MSGAPLERAASDRILVGVCGGLAPVLRLDVVVVRLAFAASVLLGGIGLVAYGALAIYLPPAAAPRRSWREGWQEALGVLCLVGSATIGLGTTGLLISPGLLVPSALLAAGVALVWRQVALSRPGVGAGRPWAREAARVGGGLVLLGAGAWLFLAQSGDVAKLSSALITGAFVAAGLGLLIGPRLREARADAAAERHERIRSEEFARVAGRLHDSVLQTLALIQRVDDPKRAQSLARRQERELRGWLYGGEQPGEPATLASALRAAAADVEEHYGIAVVLVQPSDGPLDADLEALAGAAREAMTNAARHSGAESISVLARVGDEEASVFVRDRGGGFDLGAVAEDRRGVRESIVARMARHGGRAEITSAPGAGTEVDLVLPRRVSA